MDKWKNTLNGKLDLKVYLGKGATAAIIGFLFFIQLVSADWRPDRFISAEFWTNFITNLMLALMTYSIWLYDYKVKSQNDPRYTNVLAMFVKLINQILAHGQTAELRLYGDDEFNTRIDKLKKSRILATGFTEAEYEEMQLAFVSRSQLKKGIEHNGKQIRFTKRQIKLIIKSQKPINLEPIDTTYLLSDTSDSKAYTLQFNEHTEIRKLIFTKALKFSVWAVFVASIAWTKKDTSFVEVMALMTMRLSAMVFAMWGGSNDGTNFTTVLKRSYYKYCVSYLVGFFSWHKEKFNNIEWEFPAAEIEKTSD